MSFHGPAFILSATMLCMLSAAAESQTPSGNPGAVRLLLPPEIQALPGIEVNVYFDNVALMLNPDNYAFGVTCEKGLQQSERWTYLPKPEEAGTYAFRIDVRDGANTVMASASSVLRVTPAETGAGVPVSLLCVGDSLTQASVYTQHLLDLSAAADGPHLALVGTNGPNGTPGVNRHEGYGGWTAKRFVSHYTDTARGGPLEKRGSPFLYKDASGAIKLDFGRYCQDANEGQAPDYVTIFLGPNDVAWVTDETIEATLDEMIASLDALIEAVRAFAPQTGIGIMPPTPPAASQDAFGANYGTRLTRAQYKRNQHRTVERLLEHYGGRDKERIWIVPAFVNLDCAHNYPTAAAPWNARTAEPGVRLVNGVHPSEGGYKQIGDSLYAWLKERLGEAR